MQPFPRADSLSRVKSARPLFSRQPDFLPGVCWAGTYRERHSAHHQIGLEIKIAFHVDTADPCQAQSFPSGSHFHQCDARGSLPLFPVHPLSGYAGGIFLSKLFFFFFIAQCMDCNKIFQAPLSDPKGEADALTHSKKSLFQIYMYSKPLEFFSP